MKIRDILRRNAGRHIGYAPRSVSFTSLNKSDLVHYKKLKRIPSKITAYFVRENIETVHRTTYAKRVEENDYIITSTDGTLFYVSYS